MALPTSRNTTYTAGSQVKSADLDDIQDCIISAKHGDVIRNVSPFSGQVQTAGGFVSVGGTAGYMVSTASAILSVSLPLTVGERIKTVSYLLFGDGAADVTVKVVSMDATMTGTQIGTLTTTNQAASWSVLTIDVTDTTVAANGSVFIEFSANATGLRVGSISYTCDRL